VLVPHFDLKFLTRLQQMIQELQIGGTSAPLPKFAKYSRHLLTRTSEAKGHWQV